MNTPKDLQITSIEAIECRIPLERPFNLGVFHIAHRDYTIVRIHTAEGYVGVAYMLSRNAEVAATINRNVVPVWIGQSAHEVEQLWQKARFTGHRLGVELGGSG
ncbi:MAG: hypothetical protein ABI947_02235 [Chloroflexota bacterium]